VESVVYGRPQEFANSISVSSKHNLINCLLLRSGMAGKSKRAKLMLSVEDLAKLEQLSRARIVPKREAQRAEILLRYHAGENIASLSRSLQMTRVSMAQWMAQALAVGPAAALKDSDHRPKEPVIGDDAKAWVVPVACSEPKDVGYAAETWSRQACHSRSEACGGSGLSRVVKSSQGHRATHPGRATAASGED